MESISLLELNTLVRESIEMGVPDEYWVQAELSEVRTNASGHCYVELVQKSERSHTLVAKARGIIWAQVYAMLKPYFESVTHQLLAAGIKVLVKVSVSFHELYGYSLIVNEIDPTYTLGDLARRRQEIISKLEEEGILNMNKELPMPVLPQRVAVVSSASAAGFGDFCDQLRQNAYGFFFHVELFAAKMQGAQLEKSVMDALTRICDRQDDFDVVVIIRGGGATSELADFDSYLLASVCAQFPLPVITGIGHERDDTVLDMVAHTRVKTPTAAAEFLIQQLQEAAEALAEVKERIYGGARRWLEAGKLQLAAYATGIPQMALRQLAQARVSLTQTSQRMVVAANMMRMNQRHQLALLSQHVDDASPERLLARGYSLTLKDGKVVRQASEVVPGDVLETRLQHGTLTSVVQKTEK